MVRTEKRVVLLDSIPLVQQHFRNHRPGTRAIVEAKVVFLKMIEDILPNGFSKFLIARGTERYGIVVSSQAYRLKPLAIDVRPSINPVNWFLDGKDDVRSSYFLEDVATEFQVQGLELDWTCAVWDGDLRLTPLCWQTFSYKVSKWQNILTDERLYLIQN